ncbi:hypothetical protein P9112_006638 [Eukaryota sp. TZLM1-RC]
MALRLANISDFTPAEDCVVTLTEDSGKLAAADDTTTAMNEIATSSVNISLKSCLACSGCVTSAEVVLLSSQSLATLFKFPQPIVVSITPQARASFAGFWGVSGLCAMRRLSGLFKTLFPSSFVVDMSTAVDVALLATKAELEQRMSSESRLPLLVSACSGLVCYIEKLHPDVIPLLSNIPSPQYIQAKLVADRFPELHHVVVAPCHDRKLEAVRDELNFRSSDSLSDNGVDCVVTASEVLSLFEESSIDGVEGFSGPMQITEADFDLMFDSSFESLLPSRHFSTDGYNDFVFKSFQNTDLPWSVPKRRGGARHCYTEQGIGFGEVFGFREVQNLLRAIKKGKCDLSLVEVFACPKACLNGGGQIGSQHGAANEEHYPRTEAGMVSTTHHEPSENPIALRLMENDWLQASFSYKNNTSNPARLDW